MCSIAVAENKLGRSAVAGCGCVFLWSSVKQRTNGSTLFDSRFYFLCVMIYIYIYIYLYHDTCWYAGVDFIYIKFKQTVKLCFIYHIFCWINSRTNSWNSFFSHSLHVFIYMMLICKLVFEFTIIYLYSEIYTTIKDPWKTEPSLPKY